MMKSVVLLLLLLLLSARVQGIDVFADYGVPTTDRASLDLDYRDIVAQTGLATASGLQQAKRIYQDGLDGTATGTTLQSIGTNAFTDFDTFAAFASFYGNNDEFAETYLQAALDTTVSSLSLGARTVELSASIPGRTRTVRYGVLILRVWMAVASALEQAVHQVDLDCTNNDSAALTAWNQAYALYTGSLAELDEPLGGYFLYRLAQQQAEIFGTTPHGQEAPLNAEMMDKFVQGKQMIQDCRTSTTELRTLVDRMLALLRVPVLQGALRQMYAFDEEGERRPVSQGEAAVFGLTAAGIVALCSEGFAQVVWDDLRYGKQAQGSYTVVKGAMERHYECLGISCADMGGIITSRGDSYVPRAEACGNVRPVPGAGYDVSPPQPSSSTLVPPKSSSSSKDRPSDSVVATIAIASSIVVLALAVVVVQLVRRRRQRQSQKRAAAGSAAVHVQEGTGNLVLTEAGTRVQID